MLAKNIFKIIGRVLLLLVLLLIVFLIVMFAVHTRLNKKEFDYLTELGYANVVTAKDYELNVCSYGNENSSHKFVALSGLGVQDYSVTLRKVTDELADDNLIIFPDRAGYGLSEDTSLAMTTENVVENYRAALKNAGFDGPYILLPHSLSGAYATYWESTYPEEIEGVVFVDCTQLKEGTVFDDDVANPALMDFFYKSASNVGLHRLALRKYWYYLPDSYSEEEQKISDYLNAHQGQSKALSDESNRLNEICADAYKSIVKNDVPKVYINASWGIRTEEDFEESWNWTYTNALKNGIPMMKPDDAQYAEICRKTIEQANELTETELMPYLELMGNCECVNLSGDHYIFEQKPEECAEIIKDFLNKL